MTHINARGKDDVLQVPQVEALHSPMDRFGAADVFIVAYPKSGSTWFQNLAAGLLFELDVEETPDTRIQELVPDVHYQGSYERVGETMLFKSHEKPRADYRRVVYLLRDGRDVAVSHWHHRTALDQVARTEADMLSAVRADARRWVEHVHGWQTNPYSASLITVRYEDLLQDAPGQLRRVCEFIGLERSDRSLETVARQASFERMRAKEKRFGWANPIWPKDKPFIRRGIAGSYRDELTPSLLEAFLHEAGDTLSRYDYM